MRCPIILLLAAFLALAQTSGAAPAPEELRAVQVLEQAEKNPQDQAPLGIRRTWARLIRKISTADPLRCPRCGATMRVIAVIDQEDRRGLPAGAPSRGRTGPARLPFPLTGPPGP